MRLMGKPAVAQTALADSEALKLYIINRLRSGDFKTAKLPEPPKKDVK